jgi:hypothetical protein
MSLAGLEDAGAFRREVLRQFGLRLLDAVLSVPGFFYILAAALLALREGAGTQERKPRLLWGARPITSLPALSALARRAGHVSEVAVIERYATTQEGDFDHLVFSRKPLPGMRRIANTVLAFRFFAHALHRYDIFHYFFDGGVLQRTGLWWLEMPLLRFCGKRLVLLPYGSDTFVYDRLPDVNWRHALMINYSALGSFAARIERRIRRATRYADVVVGCLVHVVNLPRWDILPLTYYPVDTDRLQPVWPRTEGAVRIGHAPNHRGAKGTEFIVRAVDELREAGHDVELVLIEGRPHAEAMVMLAGCDIVVEQLIFGYALTAMEAMALGKVVITGIDPEASHYRLFRRYSFLDELPAVAASPETIYNCLKRLLAERSRWPSIGQQCRAFAERRHSFAACSEMWQAIYGRIWRREAIDLINFYHPLGKYLAASRKVH